MLIEEPVGGDIGNGFHLFQSSYRNQLIELPNTESDWIQGGVDVLYGTTYSVYLVEDHENVIDNLSVSASLSYPGLGNGLSASAKILNKVVTDDYSICVLVDVQTIISSKSLKNAILKQEALDTLKSSENLSDFVSSYGTGVIIGKVYGGRLIGTMRLNTKSIKEKMDLSVSLGGYCGTFQSSVDFSRSIDKVHEYKVERQSIYQSGVSPELELPSVGELKEYAAKFHKLVANTNKAQQTTLFVEYADLPRILCSQPIDNNKFHKTFMQLNRTFYEREKSIRNLLKSRDKADKVARNADFLLKDFASPYNREYLESAKNEAGMLITKIDDVVKKITLDPVIEPEEFTPAVPVFSPVIDGEPVIALTLRFATNGTVADMGDWIELPEKDFRGLSIQLGPAYPSMSIEYSIYPFVGTTHGVWTGRDGQSSPVDGHGGTQINGISMKLIGENAHKYNVRYEISNRGNGAEGKNGTVVNFTVDKDGVIPPHSGYRKAIRVTLQRRAP